MNKLLSVLMSIAVAFAILTGAIALPILVRPFYYAQIDPLDMEEVSGLSRGEIIEAYNDVLDFCTGVTDEFSAGVLPFSESGASHFADCRVLFILDFIVFGVSAAVIVLLAIVGKRHKLYRFGGRSPGFWGAAVLCAVIIIAAALAATDFDRAFEIFHGIFFPGKENWVFDPDLDPVILIMPEEFFRNCAILIASAIAASSAVIMICGRKRK